MDVEKRRWTSSEGWQGEPSLKDDADVVFAFGNTSLIGDEAVYRELRSAYPEAHIVGCSTGGEILDRRVFDDSLVALAATFNHVEVALERVRLQDAESNFEAGRSLATALTDDDLRHVFVLSDGIHVNGSELVRGLSAHLPARVHTTGGLAADEDRFEYTPLWADGLYEEPTIAVLGFYGDRLQVGHGAVGGWDPFGPDRLVTRSEGNVLYELDGRSALSLYKRYLGPYAEQLPASGLRFPLQLRTQEGEDDIVRSTLGVDEEEQSITFAGDVPEGSYTRFMKTNVERIIDGAVNAARSCRPSQAAAPAFGVLVSCIGRKWVLQQRTEEEVEEVSDVLGRETPLVGFYSYGEIAPAQPSLRGELHNQTMTITTFAER